MTTTTSRATGTFTISGWDEKQWAEGRDMPALTHARYTNSYRGDLEGEGVVELLMVYSAGRPEDGHEAEASAVGYERVSGSLAGRQGTFVLQTASRHEDGVATTTWTIVPGSATGELVGLRGKGAFAASTMEVAYTLDYYFE